MAWQIVFALLAQTTAPSLAPAPETSVDPPPGSELPADTAEEPSAPPPNIVVTGKKPEDNVLRCYYEKQLGSSIRKKICRSPAQARAEAEGARAFARDMVDRQDHVRATEIRGD